MLGLLTFVANAQRAASDQAALDQIEEMCLFFSFFFEI
jgi:hypothetical protein